MPCRAVRRMRISTQRWRPASRARTRIAMTSRRQQKSRFEEGSSHTLPIQGDPGMYGIGSLFNLRRQLRIASWTLTPILNPCLYDIRQKASQVRAAQLILLSLLNAAKEVASSCAFQYLFFANEVGT